jgi:hypothetical protein
MKLIKIKTLLLVLCLFSLVRVCYSDTTLTKKDFDRITPYILNLTKEINSLEKNVDLKLENLLKKITNIKKLEEFYWTSVNKNIVKEIEKAIKSKNDYIEVLEKEMKKARADENLPLVADYEERIASVKEVLASLNRTKDSYLAQQEVYGKLNTKQENK